jgi:dihydroorotate dehydrogenase
VVRLIEDGALINRLGFNNGGHAQALARLRASVPPAWLASTSAPTDAADRAADYAAGVRLFAGVALISRSMRRPNTPRTCDLQARQRR